MAEIPRLIVALDMADGAVAQGLVRALQALPVQYKVGMELLTSVGPGIVRDLCAAGHEVLLDLKLHEIPTSVERAANVALALGASMVTVHASGGRAMMRAAVEAAGDDMAVLALTVVTSLTEADLHELGIPSTCSAHGLRLARLAQASGCQGVITSHHEAAALRVALGPSAHVVVAGVRPEGSDPGDQVRAGTPLQAVRAGASHVIVGRPITRAADPASVAQAILNEMHQA